MGRATIVSEAGSGYYTIKVDLGASRFEARVVYYQIQIIALDPVIAEFQAFVDSRRDAYTATLAELNVTINLYVIALQADPPASKAALDFLRKNVVIVTKNSTSRLAEYQANNTILEELKLKKENLEKKLADVQAAPKDRTIGAWCADYTTGATGEVRTAEVPGEPQAVLIAPEAPVPALWTGITLARAAMSPEQAYYNAAILPGWQKFLPLYRFGVITALDVDTNTANVTLENAISSAQNLTINAVSGHSAVPVQYMDCHAAAFEVGDHVLLMYPNQEPTEAIVIGFKDNPKPCLWSAWYGTWNGAVHYMNGYLGMGTAIEDFFQDTAEDYTARWNGAALPVNYDTPTGRMWGEAHSTSELKPQIEILKAPGGGNHYLFLRPQIFRAGTPTITYTMTGTNEFALYKGAKRLFSYAYLVSNGYTTGQNPNIVCRPFLVGGIGIVEPMVDEQPLLPHVDGKIPGWSPPP